jgi:PII interaction protein X
LLIDVELQQTAKAPTTLYSTMTAESYLNHPTFGLLYRICDLGDGQELFTTLYAQRMFFLVKNNADEGIAFQPMTRSDSRMMVDNRLRILRRDGDLATYGELQAIQKQTFS